MVRSTRILHENEEYLIQDEGVTEAARTVTFLARPGALASTGGGTNGIKPIRTNHGDWLPVAVWNKGAFQLLTEGARDLTKTLHLLLSQYLEGKKEKGGPGSWKQYYYIEKNDTPDFTLAASHPYGLVLNVYSEQRLARDRLKEEENARVKAEARQTGCLKDFLVKAADHGYAGAILDNVEPLSFCLDHEENMVFLKLSMNEDEEVDEYLLEENGTWSRYEGEDIEFFLDQDRCDRNMVENLGDIPFLGHGDLDFVWTLEKTDEQGAPFILSGEEGPFQGLPGGRVVLLFHTKDNALQFMMERGLFGHEAVRLDHLSSLLHYAKKNNLSVLLEPFSHRAVGGVLWLNGEDVILDSFSGFWVKGDGWSFVKEGETH